MTFDLSTIKSLDVFSFEKLGKQTGLGLVINGVPHLLWTHVYQNLEMTNPHSVSVLSRLESGKHFISINSGEMKEIKGRYNVTLYPGFNSSVFYFLTAEGFNRVIMEIDTSRMKDKKIAKTIEDRKNQMAAVFTQYEAGTLALPGPKKKANQVSWKISQTGVPLVAPVFKDCKQIAKSLGFPDATANLMALEETQMITGRDMEYYVKAIQHLPALPEDKRLSSSVVAEKFGISRPQSNKFLADNGLVEPFGNEWILTTLGKKFGVMSPTTITNGGQVKIRHSPKWSPDVVAYLKKKNPVKGQKQLC